ncbi:RAMP superfamily CRISPR-associated protein [Vibrio metschnikovii]|uniref:RAMP superfamily CRISPR-associated protein n=1 Tax=Vibrio metschnikovii TaxID=28172 RepID=UPI001C2F29E9|nr:RAMP superfamily CRISPR-associated protein [Vibrio metschnikovii]
MPKDFIMRDQHRLLALIELEALSAHGVFTGHGTGTQDNQLVRDANGLPALPSSSIAGVLRHAVASTRSLAAAEDMFGFASGDQGQMSRVSISWGFALDSQGNCYQGLTQLLDTDPVIKLLLSEQPVLRPRVRLNQYGSADNGGLFHLAFAPKGVRYRLFLELTNQDQNGLQDDWATLCQALASPMLRFGHGTHSGFGAFKCNAIKTAQYNLLDGDVIRYARRTRDRNSDAGLNHFELPKWHESGINYRFSVQAEGGLAIGGGTQPLSSVENPALIPLRESVISWQGQQASLVQQVVIPGSSLKGALAHRTEFYANVLTENWATEVNTVQHSEKHELVSAIFGNASDLSDGQSLGQAGQLLFEDIYVENPVVVTQMHNKIDPFTGGTVTGALFCDEMLWQPELNISIWLQAMDVDDKALEAFEMALDDLKIGMLPIGARSGRGMGTLIEKPATEGEAV